MNVSKRTLSEKINAYLDENIRDSRDTITDVLNEKNQLRYNTKIKDPKHAVSVRVFEFHASPYPDVTRHRVDE